MNHNDIGKFIKGLRESKGWTQEELAEFIPITRQAVSRWERGKSIPDSQTLVILSEIFDVSINELLSGKRIAKKEIVKESEKIVLDIVDKNILIQKKIKSIIIIFISSILIFVFGFLFYYFFATYNSVKVYSIGGMSDHFYLQDGLMIVTKQKIFFKLGDLEYSKDIKIDNVSLSFEKDGEEKLLYKNVQFNKLIIENYGYEEYFYFEDLEDILKGIKMDIYYDDGKTVETMDLEFLLVLSNNKFTFFKRMIDDVKTSNDSMNDLEKKIAKFMIKNGSFKDECYTYKVDNKTFKYFLNNNQLILERKTSNCVEFWNKNLNGNFLSWSDDCENLVNNFVVICSSEKCFKNTKEQYIKFNSYLEQYIL